MQQGALVQVCLQGINFNYVFNYSFQRGYVKEVTCTFNLYLYYYSCSKQILLVNLNFVNLSMLLAGRCNYLVVQTKDHFYLQYHFANSLLTWGENRTIINFIREVKLLRNIKGNIENVMTDIAIKSFIST